MNALTNAQIAEQDRETERKFGTQSNGTGLGQACLSYTFGPYQVVWAANNGEVRDTTNGDSVVYRGTKDDCIAWAKSK